MNTPSNLLFFQEQIIYLICGMRKIIVIIYQFIGNKMVAA